GRRRNHGGGAEFLAMIRESLKEFSRPVLRGDVFATAAALLMALAAFYFLQSLVDGLIAPAVAAILSEPRLYALSFTVGESEFDYGIVLTALILLVLAFVVVALLSKARRGAESRSTET
ncbi:MAG TPA: MscL family protein, partial [Solirubrobacterales bacterium]|nr:MscL family protein [Solirubrobacterales bacterium]